MPGYGLMVEAVIMELRAREIELMPDSLKTAVLSFVSNVRLLNEFVNIVFSKTLVYDAVSVNITLDMVTTWLTKIHRN